MFLSIIIPAYNEASRLPATLEIIRAYLSKQDYQAEVIVINDGSQDATTTKVKAAQANFPQLRLIDNQVNQGKGGVVRQGMLEAKGEYCLFTDADNSTPIEQLDKLLKFLPEYEVIIGSRYLRKDSFKIKQPYRRRLLSRFSNLIIQAFLLPGIKDTQCGFKLFSQAAAQKIFSQQKITGWVFDVEVLVIARREGYKIKEVAVDWYNSENSTLRAAQSAIRSFADLLLIYKQKHNCKYGEKT